MPPKMTGPTSFRGCVLMVKDGIVKEIDEVATSLYD